MNKEEAGLSPEAKLEKMFGSWVTPPGIDFVSPEAEKAYRERATRIKNAIQLKMPDRVPVIPLIGFFPAHYAGITTQEAMYDYEKACQAYEKYTFDHQMPTAALMGLGMSTILLTISFLYGQGMALASICHSSALKVST